MVFWVKQLALSFSSSWHPHTAVLRLVQHPAAELGAKGRKSMLNPGFPDLVVLDVSLSSESYIVNYNFLRHPDSEHTGKIREQDGSSVPWTEFHLHVFPWSLAREMGGASQQRSKCRSDSKKWKNRFWENEEIYLPSSFPRKKSLSNPVKTTCPQQE